jgi:hypothetical protein
VCDFIAIEGNPDRIARLIEQLQHENQSSANKNSNSNQSSTCSAKSFLVLHTSCHGVEAHDEDRDPVEAGSGSLEGGSKREKDEACAAYVACPREGLSEDEEDREDGDGDDEEA